MESKDKLFDVILQTQERVFHQDTQTPKSGTKKQGQPSFFSDFRVFGYLIKHSFKCLLELLNPFIILGEIQSKVCKILCQLRSGIQTTVMVVNSFVFSLRIINKFEKDTGSCAHSCIVVFDLTFLCQTNYQHIRQHWAIQNSGEQKTTS